VGRWLGGGAGAALSSTVAAQPLWLWVVMAGIFIYYLIATLLPIDVIIGRLDPFLALALLVMVSGLAYSVLTGRLPVPAFTLANLHPASAPAWPITSGDTAFRVAPLIVADYLVPGGAAAARRRRGRRPDRSPGERCRAGERHPRLLSPEREPDRRARVVSRLVLLYTARIQAGTRPGCVTA
jgi:hypothetical protein